jgi:3-oxoacyl-[acyl-carrier protein] reductase
METAPMLEGEIALVTGASRGIGRAIAQRLAEAGALVVGTATSAEGAAAIGAALAAAPRPGAGEVLDSAVPASIEALVTRLDTAGRLPTILVNNAAITRDTLLMRMKDEDWEAVIATNLTGVFRLSKACVRRMIKDRRGRIVNITSIVGTIGNPGQTNYAAAKAGLIGFTKSLARELASRNVTVNAVAPGFIDTDMTRALSEAQREALAAQIPLGRLGSVDDVAAAVLYLVSPSGAYLTGQTLHVNGGMHMP